MGSHYSTEDLVHVGQGLSGCGILSKAVYLQGIPWHVIMGQLFIYYTSTFRAEGAIE